VNQLSRFQTVYCVALAVGFTVLVGCVPITRPTLPEARLGQGQLVGDTTLQPGETRAEILAIDPSRRELRVRTDDGRAQALTYDPNNTKVVYHGREYSVENLESGDVIAFQTRPRTSNHVDTIRVQEPVQARAGSSIARGSPQSPPPRAEVIEGTVERIDYDRGVFDLRPRVGRTVTVALPYNARTADVETFRRLRRGDYVRLEGEFLNPESFQLLAFLPDFDRSQGRR
jgi:hypothetical protein